MTVTVVLMTLLGSVLGGWAVVSGVLRLAARSGDAGQPARGGVLRGGTWVGILERLAVTGTILLGHPEGIAVVVAVKGLGRYPELARNPEVSERFVIGSLASLVWSAGLGAVGVSLLG